MKLDKNLTEAVKVKTVEIGADLVGIASVERFKDAPQMMRPEAHMPDVKSVIAFAVHYPDATIELPGGPTLQDRGPFEIGLIPKLEEISYFLARFIAKRGYEAYPLPGTGFWRMKPYKELPAHCAAFSNMHAAVAAGLGEFGWHGMLMTPEYGPRVRVGSVMTNAPLYPDPMYSEEPLCDRCMACLKKCPTDAFKKELGNPKVRKIKIGNHTYEYANKNLWRCAWAEQFGLDLKSIPDKVDEKVVMERVKKPNSFVGGEYGNCVCVCLPPYLRSWDKKYSPYPRRKKTRPLVMDDDLAYHKALYRQTQKIAFRRKIKKMGTVPFEKLKNVPVNVKKGYPWKTVKENFSALIVIGMDYPKSFSTADDQKNCQDSFLYFQRATTIRLTTTALDIARFLDNLGYDAMVLWTDVNNLTAHGAKKLGLLENMENSEFEYLAAPVHAYTIEHKKWGQFAGILTNAPILNTETIK